MMGQQAEHQQSATCSVADASAWNLGWREKQVEHCDWVAFHLPKSDLLKIDPLEAVGGDIIRS